MASNMDTVGTFDMARALSKVQYNLITYILEYHMLKIYRVF